MPIVIKIKNEKSCNREYNFTTNITLPNNLSKQQTL